MDISTALILIQSKCFTGMVCGIRSRSVLPYGTGISYEIYMHLNMSFFFFRMMFVDGFFTCFCKLVLIHLTERSTIPACPSFIGIIHKGNTESTVLF